MTELLIEKFYEARELTGLRGVIFLIILGLFVLSFLSDAVYQTATAASAVIKFLLLIALGISFGTLVQDIKLPRFTRPSFKTTKRPKTRIVRESIISAPAGVESQVIASQTIDPVADSIKSNSILPAIRGDLQSKKNQERATKQREFFATKADQTAKKNRDYLGVNISDIVKISETYGSQVTIDEIKELHRVKQFLFGLNLHPVCRAGKVHIFKITRH